MVCRENRANVLIRLKQNVANQKNSFPNAIMERLHQMQPLDICIHISLSEERTLLTNEVEVMIFKGDIGKAKVEDRYNY